MVYRVLLPFPMRLILLSPNNLFNALLIGNEEQLQYTFSSFWVTVVFSFMYEKILFYIIREFIQDDSIAMLLKNLLYNYLVIKEWFGGFVGQCGNNIGEESFFVTNDPKNISNGNKAIVYYIAYCHFYNLEIKDRGHEAVKIYITNGMLTLIQIAQRIEKIQLLFINREKHFYLSELRIQVKNWTEWRRNVKISFKKRRNMMNNSRILGNNISLELAGRHMDISSFASMIGFSEKDVHKLVEGRLFVLPRCLSKISEVLGTSKEELLTDKGVGAYNSLIHNFREFNNVENRELVLDLIDFYADLEETLE